MVSVQVLRRSLSNIRDCSTAGSESNGPTDFASGHRGAVAPAVVDTVRRPSAATTTSEHATVGRPARIARRPLNHPVPEHPIPSRAVDHDDETPSRPERRSGSLDSKRPPTRKHSAFHGLSASALLAESTGTFQMFFFTCRVVHPSVRLSVCSVGILTVTH